jgi:hypothetical protein
MCSIINNHIAKECTCKFAHLCKRRNKLSASIERSALELNATDLQTALFLPLINFVSTTKKMHAEESDHI